MNSTVKKLNSMIPISSPVNAGNTRSNFNLGKTMGFSSGMTASGNAGNSSKGSWSTPLLWFMVAFLILLGLFSYFYTPFTNSLQNWMDSLNIWMTGKGYPPEDPKKDIPTSPPVSPEEESTMKPSGFDSVVEKMLPPAKEVFTVSKNDYSYYDAAPLCKALGAELATYDQVKHAWQKGADWCNYGWVKGQMAVYPTQSSTYEELQQGPEEQKGACGKPGVNGGYFDNPELKFGVTCVGKKPVQSQHDATSISANSTLPLTASGLEFEKKVLQFKEGSDSIGVLPFNKERWN